MRMIEIPNAEELEAQEDDYYGNKLDRFIEENYDIGYMDPNPWDVLESVDNCLAKYGLEIVYFNEESYEHFAIVERVKNE
jgi:hypothetical protein